MPSKKRTTDETKRIIDVVDGLEKADLHDFMEYARFKSSRGAHLSADGEADDLVQNVLLKAWMAERGCAIDVKLTAFIKNCIRSAASQRTKAAYTEAANRAEFRHYQARCSGLPDKGRQIAYNIVAAVKAELADDAEALNVLESMLDGKPRREACREFGMESRTYNTARKRIARRARHAAAIATAGFGRTSFFRCRPS